MSRAATIEDTWKIRFRSKGQIRTSLVTAKDHKRAERLAQAYPNVISVAKARNDYYRIANSELRAVSDELKKDITQSTTTPLAMDEFLWMRRNRRIENRKRDGQKA